ncbi:hypothetical protein AHF37_03077 [Paragonimus kellicotti]|nr:hypothetical protein AHF37_03077 [Paragonimus kellicotti]
MKSPKETLSVMASQRSVVEFFKPTSFRCINHLKQSTGRIEGVMTESTTIGTRFHTSAAALSATTNNTCPSNYPDYCSNCGTKPQSKQPTEAEVNRKVMEILRRMTSQQVDENAPNSVDTNRILIKPLAPQLSAGSFSLPLSTTTVAPSYPASSPQLLITTSTVKPTIPLLPRDDKLSHQQQSSSVSAVLGRRCSCSRSCCLKLYCECFAAGVFCTDCSCISCYNLAEHEEFRRKAIMRIVTRKPDAFQSKIVKRPLTTSTTDTSLNSREQIKSARWDTDAPNSVDTNRILIKPLAPQLSAGSFSLPLSTTTVAPSYPASSPQLLITTSTVKPTIPLLPRDDKLSHQQQSSSVSAVLGRRCSCSRSCCLKLYCECFAAGVFCTDCSCISCYNLAEHEEFRRKAIMRIVTRKPDAFQSKIDGENHTTLNPNAPRVTSQSSLQCVTNPTFCADGEEKTPTDSPAESSGSSCSAPGGGRLTPKPSVLRAIGDNLQPVSPVVSVCPSEENRKILSLDISVHSPAASSCSVRRSLSKEQLPLEPLAVNGSNACVTERTTAPIIPCVSRPNSPTTATTTVEPPALTTGVIKSTPTVCDPGPGNEAAISVPAAATTSNLLATWLALISSVAPSPPVATVPLGAEDNDVNPRFSLTLSFLSKTLVLFNSPIIPTIPQLPTPVPANLCPSATSVYGACNSLSDSPASTPPAATTEAQYTAEELATFDRILRQRKLQEQRSEFDQLSNADHTSQCNSDGKKSDPDAPQGCTVFKMDPDPSPPEQTAVTSHEVRFQSHRCLTKGTQVIPCHW